MRRKKRNPAGFDPEAELAAMEAADAFDPEAELAALEANDSETPALPKGISFADPDQRDMLTASISNDKISLMQALENTQTAYREKYGPDARVSIGQDPTADAYGRHRFGITVTTEQGDREFVDLTQYFDKIQRAQQHKLEQSMDPTQAAEVGVGTRLKTSIMNPEQTYATLQKDLGPERVAPRFEGGRMVSPAVMDQWGNNPLPYNPEGLDATDIPTGVVDLGTGALSGAASAAGAASPVPGGAYIAGAGADVALSAGKQALAANLSGVGGVSGGQVLLDTVLGAGAEGAAQLGTVLAKQGIRLGKKGIGALSDNAAAKYAQQEKGRFFSQLEDEVGSQVAEDIPRGMSPEAVAARSAEVEAAMRRGGAGADFAFSEGEATGSKAALLSERYAAQHPATMDAAYLSKLKRIDGMKNYIDAAVGRMASDPSTLGNVNVGTRVAKAIEGRIQGLREVRAAEAGRLYQQANAMAGGAPIVGTSNVRQVLERELGDIIPELQPEAAKKLKATLKALDGPEGQSMSIERANQLLKTWTGASKYGSTILEGLDDANKRRVAAAVTGAIVQDLDAAAAKGTAAAGKLLEARRAWAKHSADLDLERTTIKKRILKLASDETATPEKIMQRFSEMSSSEMESVLKVLREVDPDAIGQVQAQTLLNAVDAAGGFGVKVANEMQTGPAIRPKALLEQLSPSKGKGAIFKKESMRALFGGSKGTADEITTILDGLQILSRNPGVEGSDTFAKYLQDLVNKKGNGIREIAKDPFAAVASKFEASFDDIMSRAAKGDKKAAKKVSQLVTEARKAQGRWKVGEFWVRKMTRLMTQAMGEHSRKESDRYDAARRLNLSSGTATGPGGAGMGFLQ